LDVVFFVDAYMMEVRLCIFCLHLDNVIRPWTPTPRPTFWLEFFVF